MLYYSTALHNGILLILILIACALCMSVELSYVLSVTSLMVQAVHLNQGARAARARKSANTASANMVRKGANGVSTNGVTANLLFFGGGTFAAAPVVLTPFVRTIWFPLSRVSQAKPIVSVDIVHGTSAPQSAGPRKASLARLR